MSLLWNCTPILLFSKSKTNLKFKASTAIAWSCKKLRLFHNPELLWYKAIKTRRRIQQRYSSWNLFVYIFTVSVCKICTLLNEKKQKKDKQTAYVLTLHYTPSPCCRHLYTFGLTPSFLPSNMQQKYNASRFFLPIIYNIKNSIVTAIVFQLSMIPHLHHVSTKKHGLLCLRKLSLRSI